MENGQVISPAPDDLKALQRAPEWSKSVLEAALRAGPAGRMEQLFAAAIHVSSTRAPSPEKVVTETARLRGETVAPHGAAAANRLGLTTQVPMRTIYLTSGRSRRLNLGAQSIELEHAPRWQLTNAGRPSGEVVRALAWAGRAQAHEFLARIKRELPEEVRKELVASRGALPEWLARTISAELAA